MKNRSGRIAVYVGGVLAASALLQGAHAPELSALQLSPPLIGANSSSHGTPHLPQHPPAQPWQALFAAATR